MASPCRDLTTARPTAPPALLVPPAPSGARRRPATGTHGLPRRPGRGLLVGAAAGLTLALLPGTAAAVRTEARTVTEATTPEQATELVAEADHQLEVVTEQVNEARVQLARQQEAARGAEQAVADAQDRLTALEAQMRQVVRTAYTTRDATGFSALMTSGSPEEFLARVATLDSIAGHTGELLTEVSAAARTAADAQLAAEAAGTAAQQQEVVETHSGPTLEPPAEVVADTDAAQTVLDAAFDQLGDPYVWAAGGPRSFDCSGLTSYAFAAAGIDLPHSSQSQATMGTAVSRGDLQPGDLVFFYSPVSHVGIYLGDGQMVPAPTSGDVVTVSSVDMAGYASARRLL